jgi:aerobic-type carbon monoxide dehydrogenase small subunit (CoxS/CutS family)
VITFTVNGQSREVDTPGDRPLLEVLREDLNLTGTHYGCGEGACRACTVLVDGKAVVSCLTPASEVAGKAVTTIEGLAEGDKLHPVQQAFLEHNAFQCGYCTSGMILSLVGVLKETPNADEAIVMQRMNQNLCRCCSYDAIHAAIKACLKGGAK